MANISTTHSDISTPISSGANEQSRSIRKRKSTSNITASDASPSSRPSQRPLYLLSQPSLTALPPPIIPYPEHPMSAHPHFVPCYPVYSHHPVYIPLPASRSPTNIPTKPGEPPQPNLAPSPTQQQPTSPVYYHPAVATTTIPSSPPLYGQPPLSSPSLRPVTADKREQARKVSHSAIERRRRERINDKLLQLRQLIPSCADQEHLNKMTILQSTIDYITHLKKTIERKGGPNTESLTRDRLKMQSPQF